MKHIHIVNGPNLNLLGVREPSIYGSVSFEVYLQGLQEKYSDGLLHYFQTNHEGTILDFLHLHGFAADTGIILNAGGYTHSSIAIRDAIEAIEVPVIEVHISNIYDREDFRRINYLRDKCKASFVGEGLDGYQMAIDYLVNL
ncbi:MAG: 3-dehydroquinate dehydratase [Bacteroidota bacterium]|nr:3-dehydroquinate dehydratase [Bacteroidota bacterium]